MKTCVPTNFDILDPVPTTTSPHPIILLQTFYVYRVVELLENYSWFQSVGAKYVQTWI